MPSLEPDSASTPVLAAESAHAWDYFAVLLRHRRVVVATFAVVAGLATVRASLTRPVYRATAQILIERESPNIVSFKEVAQVDAARDDYYQTQYKLLQGRALAQRTILALDLLADAEFGGPRASEEIASIKAAPPGTSPVMEGTINVFLRRLKVQPIRNSRLVNVAFEGYRPELAASIVNRLAQFYIEQALDFRYQTSSEASQWLATQIEQQRKKVEQAEIALQTLKEQQGIVNIEERRVLLEQKLKELGSALTGLRTTRLEREALYEQMRSAATPEELPEVMRSPVVQNLRIELASLERQQAQLLQRYLEQHPEVIKVRNQIVETRKKMALESAGVIRAAENDWRAAAAQEVSVASALEAAKLEALDLSRRSIQYDSIKREDEAAKQVLNSLLSRHKETDIAQELKSTNIRIVDTAAVPTEAVRPRPARDMFLGVLLGFGLAVGLAFLIDYLDNTVKTPEDVRNHLELPLLGVVPEVQGGEDALVLSDPATQGPFAEGYRVIRTALRYSWHERAPRVLLVTSTAPGEGKTLTAVNLALTLASAEGKVLLLAADMRKPRAHSLLKGSRAPGLSDVLVGQARLSDAIQTCLSGRIGLLSSGNSVPSPADLMTSEAMRTLLENLRGQYAWIVVDSPPVAAVSEPLVLASFVDGVVLVVGAEMVARNAVRTTIDRLAETEARILGVVLNRTRMDRHSYYYGGRYYGHRHGRYDDYYGSSGQAAEPPPAAEKLARSDGEHATLDSSRQWTTVAIGPRPAGRSA